MSFCFAMKKIKEMRKTTSNRGEDRDAARWRGAQAGAALLQ